VRPETSARFNGDCSSIEPHLGPVLLGLIRSVPIKASGTCAPEKRKPPTLAGGFTVRFLVGVFHNLPGTLPLLNALSSLHIALGFHSPSFLLFVASPCSALCDITWCERQIQPSHCSWFSWRPPFALSHCKRWTKAWSRLKRILRAMEVLERKGDCCYRASGRRVVGRVPLTPRLIAARPKVNQR
jgi:hypothetical protein